ncbi:pyrroline-5-carboxylate reductase [Silvimonas terrae]|uniref:Pyrroline-5-carboxylate reductase n=1 Tax=Silvimonas terrae TaxID=300266 RepID=A0A840RGG2_9NEIS|nr:pyrroline-5-carboxylate reductase [Silvimonas terrae]MBB5192689.1 pyrroline-5-carboxylate reductase [Silvimonas terrae]
MKIGFIGTGNMSGAMIAGIKHTHPDWQIHGYNRSHEKLIALQNKWDVVPSDSLAEIAALADFLVVGVKPQGYDAMLAQLRPLLQPRHVIVTVAVGYPIERVQRHAGEHTKVVRSMPNTPAQIGQGMSALCASTQVSVDERAAAQNIFESFGRAVFIEESQFDVFSAVAGSLPAYVCVIIEALADAAVQHGMPRQQAYGVISQAVMGSAQLVRDGNRHPAELKDQVCSPGGTTIAAIAALEAGGLRSTLIEAVSACMARTKVLAGK